MKQTYFTLIPEMSLAGAQQIVAKGLDVAAARGLRIAISVVDRAGNLLAFARVDGAPIVTIDVAVGKARTAAFIQAPSKMFEDMINSGYRSVAATPSVVPLQGGMPVMLDGEIIGAVGVSGASGEQDQAVAALLAGSLM